MGLHNCIFIVLILALFVLSKAGFVPIISRPRRVNQHRASRFRKSHRPVLNDLPRPPSNAAFSIPQEYVQADLNKRRTHGPQSMESSKLSKHRQPAHYIVRQAITRTEQNHIQSEDPRRIKDRKLREAVRLSKGGKHHRARKRKAEKESKQKMKYILRRSPRKRTHHVAHSNRKIRRIMRQNSMEEIFANRRKKVDHMNMNKEHPVEICSCIAIGERKRECFVFTDSTRRICKKETCEMKYKCVGQSKKGLKCERKPKTHLVAPDGGNTCKVLIVDRYEYVPFAVY